MDFYNLNGDAPAINLSGSERMRSYKLAYLTNIYMEEKDNEKKIQLKTEIFKEIDEINTKITSSFFIDYTFLYSIIYEKILINIASLVFTYKKL